MKTTKFKEMNEMLSAIELEVSCDRTFQTQLNGITVKREGDKLLAFIEGNWMELYDIPETLNCFFERSGQTMDANKRLPIDMQIEVMNKYCFNTLPSKAMGLVVIRNGKILALHSNRYGYINQDQALKSFIKALGDAEASLQFMSGSYSPNLTEMVVRVNHEELLRDYAVSAAKAGMPPIVSKGAYISFLFRTNDVGTCEVGVIPRLHVAGQTIYLDEPFQRKHKDVVSYSAVRSIYEGTSKLMMTAQEQAKLVGKLMLIKVYDAEKCVEKCIKHLKLKRLSATGVEQFLESANYANINNAFQVYVLMHEFLKTEAVMKTSKEYQERFNRTLRKLVAADWSKLQ